MISCYHIRVRKGNCLILSAHTMAFPFPSLRRGFLSVLRERTRVFSTRSFAGGDNLSVLRERTLVFSTRAFAGGDNYLRSQYSGSRMSLSTTPEHGDEINEVKNNVAEKETAKTVVKKTAKTKSDGKSGKADGKSAKCREGDGFLRLILGAVLGTFFFDLWASIKLYFGFDYVTLKTWEKLDSVAKDVKELHSKGDEANKP